MYAIQAESILVANLLIQMGANVNFRNMHGDSALVIAARNGNFPAVELLLDSSEKATDIN